jgi:hypothetical protein
VGANVAGSTAGQLIDVAQGGEFSVPRFAADVALGSVFSDPNKLGRRLGLQALKPEVAAAEQPMDLGALRTANTEARETARVAGETEDARIMDETRGQMAAGGMTGHEIEMFKTRPEMEWWKQPEATRIEDIRNIAKQAKQRMPKGMAEQLAGLPEVYDVIQNPDKFPAFLGASLEEALNAAHERSIQDKFLSPEDLAMQEKSLARRRGRDLPTETPFSDVNEAYKNYRRNAKEREEVSQRFMGAEERADIARMDETKRKLATQKASPEYRGEQMGAFREGAEAFTPEGGSRVAPESWTPEVARPTRAAVTTEEILGRQSQAAKPVDEGISLEQALKPTPEEVAKAEKIQADNARVEAEQNASEIRKMQDLEAAQALSDEAAARLQSLQARQDELQKLAQRAPSVVRKGVAEQGAPDIAQAKQELADARAIAADLYSRLQKAGGEGLLNQADLDAATKLAAQRGLRVLPATPEQQAQGIRGAYVVNENGERVIYINPFAATADTAIHEIGHDVFKTSANERMRRSLMDTAMDSEAYKRELEYRLNEVDKNGKRVNTEQRAQDLALEEGVVQAFGEQHPNVKPGEIRQWFNALKASVKSMVGMKISPEDALAWMHYATTEAVPWKGVAAVKTGGGMGSEERLQRALENDSAYLKAVAAGDMETAQRMVNEAAKAAGYNEGPLYHVGQSSWTEADRPVYTQDSKELADKFLKSLRRDYPEAQAKKLYAQMENPAVQGRDIERSSFLTSSELGKEQLAEAMGKGFDSVKGYYAGLGVPEYLTTKPNQIKLADPVTYDNAGNVIPLSERFNKQSSDIRYQRPVDSSIGSNKEFSIPPSESQAIKALHINKRSFWRGHDELPEGTAVGVRIDIPAFTDNGVYVQTIHEPATPGNVGGRIGYDTSVRLTGPVKFFVKQGSEDIGSGALAIKEGRAKKHPIATVEGNLSKDRSVPLDIEEWTPIGMDPKKHSYFYDKRTGQPVEGGSESYSVGNTVFVKDPVPGKLSDFRYQRPLVGKAKEMFQEATNRANKFAEVDNLESRGGIHAVVAKGMRAFYATRSFMEGKPQAFEKAIYALSPERQVMLGEHIGQEFDQRRFIKPSNEIAEAYGEYRQQWQKFWPAENNKAGHTVRAAGGQRERLTDPYYGPFHMWSDNVRDIMTNKQGSPEYVKLQDDYIKQHVQAHQQNGIPLQEAQTRASAEFSEEIRALSVPYDPTAAGTFAGARKAQGIPLPHSWREYNIAKLLKSYDRRSAIDFAMQEHMEKSPEIMAALGSKTFFNDQPIPAQIKAAIPDISTDKSVQSILREMSGQPARKPDSVGAGASRGISALTIGTVSKATEVPTTMIAGLRYLQMSDYLPGTMKFIEKLADWSALQERSYASGLNKRDASQNMRQVSGVAENAAGFLNKFAEGVSSVTGLNQLESAARTIAQGWGEVLVQINKNKAATGDKDAVRMMDTLSPDWRTRSDADLAAQFGKLMQGSYDMTQLPAWMLESGAAPYLTWSKWSAGQYSNFVKFAIEPAMQGNVKPLIGHLLIGAMGGAAVDQIREWMNNREGRDVNWSELESWMQQNQGQLGAEGMKQLSVKLLNIVQGVGTFGIAGDIAKMVTTAAVGGTAQGIATAPVANAVFDTSKKVAAALKAIDDGEDFGLVLRQAMGDVAKTHVQVARVWNNWTDEQENLRYDDRRQRRLFDELTGAPTQAGTFSVNYGNLAERAFERGNITEKTGEEAFNLVSRARQEATSGEDYASRIRKLKTSQNAIMPSLERQPMKAARYLSFVEGAEPGKGGETLKRYYTRQNEDKYRKSLIEGMSGIR